MNQIFHLRAPHVPAFRFEWHPGAKKLYMVHVGTNPEHAECLADNVLDRGQAQMYVFLWLRGYRYKEAELNPELPVFHSERINANV